jgi:hypothetical protein
MAAKFELFKDKGGISGSTSRQSTGDHRQRPGMQVEGCGREGDRVDQDQRAWCHGGRQHRLATQHPLGFH